MRYCVGVFRSNAGELLAQFDESNCVPSDKAGSWSRLPWSSFIMVRVRVTRKGAPRDGGACAASALSGDAGG